MLFNPSVADVRRYFCNVWKKHQQGTPLEPLEMVALQWIGQPYEAEAVTHAQTKEPAYLAMNPQGAVPLLVDGDLVLSQNVAILAYLDARFPEARLLGSDTIEGKARAWRWLAFLNADVHKAFGQLFRTPPWAEDETVKNAMQQAARAQIAGMLKQADDQLANHAWLGGEEISVADIYLYVILRWATGLSVDLSQMKHLDEFQKRVAADPGVREICTQEGLQP